MAETVTYRNRYNEEGNFTVLDDRTVEWTFCKLGCRYGLTDTGEIEWVDPGGGPFISVGESLADYGLSRKIVSFDFKTDRTKVILQTEPA